MATSQLQKVNLYPAEVRDVDAFGQHLARLINHVDDPQGIRFNPRVPGTYKFDAKAAESFSKAWATPPGEPGWQVCWLLKHTDGVCGHLNLRSLPFEASVHHAYLGMGIERAWQGQGWGRKLMQVGLDWCRAASIELVTLNTFSVNTPAISLYKKFGFEIVGDVKKAFKIEGQFYDDILMALYL